MFVATCQCLVCIYPLKFYPPSVVCYVVICVYDPDDACGACTYIHIGVNSSRASRRSYDRSQSMMPPTSSSKKLVNTPTLPHTIGMKPTADDK